MKVENLTKIYHSDCGEDVVALNNVCFSLPQNGLIFVVGKSGSGKSTLLNVLSGLDKANDGKIEIDGKNIVGLSSNELDNYRNSCCGFVFQEYNLIPELNVRENISLSLELQGIKNTENQVLDVLKKVGLEEYEGRRITELSGGQKQRIAIARAIIKNPKIIFADEPTGALDDETGKNIFKLLKDLSKDKLIIVVSHDMDFALHFADCIIEIKDGKISAEKIMNNFMEETYPDNNNNENEKTWNKSRLPHKVALRIGCSNLKFHPLRLLATVILSVIAFSILGISLNISLNKYENVIYNSILSQNIACSRIDKHIENGTIIPLKYSDCEYLESFIGESFKVIYADINVETKYEDDNIFYSTLPQGYSEISKGLIKRFGFSYIGNLPRTSSEIAISDFTYCVLNKLIFLDESAKNTLGKKIIINNREYTISAIVNTNFDTQKFDVLKNTTSEETNSLIFDFQEELIYSVHNLIFVHSLDEYARNGILFESQSCYLLAKSSHSIPIGEIRKDSKNDENTNINFLPSSMLPSVLHSVSCDILYKGNRFTDFGTLFLEVYDEAKMNAPSKDISFYEVYETRKDEFGFPENFSFTLEAKNLALNIIVDFGGFYSSGDFDETIILNDTVYQEIYEKIGGKYNSLIVYNDNKNIKKFIDSEDDFSLKNKIIIMGNNYKSTLTTIRKVFYIISSIFSVFSIILLLNFVLQSLTEKTLTIGVLKANGCHFFDIMKIFISETLIISLSVFVFSILFTITGCFVLNNKFSSLAFFALNPYAFLALFAVIILFSTLGSAVCLLRILRHSPNEIIKRL